MAKGGHGGGYNKNQKRGTPGGSGSATKLTFVTLTSGHEDVYFTTESTKDAMVFQDMVQKLA